MLTCRGSTIQPLTPSPSVSAALLETSKELDFPVGVGQRTKQTGYLCLSCFTQSKKPQVLDQISTYKHSNAQNTSSALGICHPGGDSSAPVCQGSWVHLNNSSKLFLLLREPGLETNHPSQEGGAHFPEAKNHAACSTSPQGCSLLGCTTVDVSGPSLETRLAEFRGKAASSGGWVEISVGINSLLVPSFPLGQKPGNLLCSSLENPYFWS